MSYTIHAYKEIPAREGVAWSCTIKREGKAICHATNSGDGGSDHLDFTSRDERALFTEYASTLSQVEYERESEVLSKMITVAQMNRKRSVPFILEGDDFDNLGQFRLARATMNHDDVVTWLRTTAADRNPQVWDKTVGAFAPVIQSAVLAGKDK